MKKLVFILLIGMFACGCIERIHKTERCDYCSGLIFWHKTRSGLFSESYTQDYEYTNGKYYHKWCDKWNEEDL